MTGVPLIKLEMRVRTLCRAWGNEQRIYVLRVLVGLEWVFQGWGSEKGFKSPKVTG